MIANGYAHRTPHNPISKRFDSGPQTFRNSSEFHPNGKETHPMIILIARKNGEKILLNLITITLTRCRYFLCTFVCM